MMSDSNSSFITKLIVLLLSLLYAPTLLAHTSATNLNMFSPNLYQERYTRVESSSTLKPGEVSLNLFGDSALNTMSIYGSGPADTNDLMSFMHLGVAIGLTSRLELGARFPFLVNQSLDPSQIGRSIRLYESGFTDSLAYMKYKLFNNKSHGVTLIGQVGQSFSKNVFYNGENGGVDLLLGIIYERIWKTWSLAINAGYVTKNPGERGASYLFYEPIESSILASVGLSKRLNESHALSLELISTMNSLELDQSDREKNSLEASLSYRRFWNQFIFVAGAGAGVMDGISEPQVRGFLGVNYKFRPLWGSSSKSSSAKELSLEPEQTPEVMSALDSQSTPEETGAAAAAPVVGSDIESEADGTEEAVTVAKESDPALVPVADTETDAGTEPEPEPLAGAAIAAGAAPIAASEGEALDENNPYKDKTYEEVVTLEEGQEDLDEELEEFTQKNIGSENAYQKIILQHIEFEFDSDQLDEVSLKILNGVLKYLNQTDYETLRIIGHTDFFGSVIYNENLSLRRAKTVMNFLEKHGIPRERMTFDGYGKRRPLETGVSETFRRKNRRVEIILKKP